MEDFLPAVEGRIDRLAPVFRDSFLARHVMTPADLERRNPNLCGGDIGMGMTDLRQMFARPTWRRYPTPRPGPYICSASTPPRGCVHRISGFQSAQCALKAGFRIPDPA